MPANTSPIFVLTPKSPGVRISTANTNRDGSTGTYGTLFTAGANGCFFKGFRVVAEGTTTAGFVRLFRQDAGSGNVELLAELIIPATTPSVGVTPAYQTEWYPPGGIVGTAGTVFKCSTQIGEPFGCFLEGGGDY